MNAKMEKNPDIKFKQLVVRFTSINHISYIVLCCLCIIGLRFIFAETPRKGPTGREQRGESKADSTGLVPKNL
jgi:hypothetical protein